eukprot:10540524-Alexandrium_andersonii.AAC.1
MDDLVQEIRSSRAMYRRCSVQPWGVCDLCAAACPLRSRIRMRSSGAPLHALSGVALHAFGPELRCMPSQE